MRDGRMLSEPVIPWLVVILRPQLTLGWGPEDPGPAFTADEVRFEAVAPDDLTGFYDRLYDRQRRFIGVQVGLLAVEELADGSWAWPYARKVEGVPQLQLLLTSDSPTQVMMVPDQAFGGRVYQSLDGEYALSFDTYFLESREREAILTGPARWVTIKAAVG